MPRSRSETLTAREAELMDVLWRHGPATAEQVREHLADRPHDSTVRTILRVLEGKGYVVRDDRGTAYVYRASVEQTGRSGPPCAVCSTASSADRSRAWSYVCWKTRPSVWNSWRSFRSPSNPSGPPPDAAEEENRDDRDPWSWFGRLVGGVGS